MVSLSDLYFLIYCTSFLWGVVFLQTILLHYGNVVFFLVLLANFVASSLGNDNMIPNEGSREGSGLASPANKIKINR